jgi:hypothetical protein
MKKVDLIQFGSEVQIWFIIISLLNKFGSLFIACIVNNSVRCFLVKELVLKQILMRLSNCKYSLITSSLATIKLPRFFNLNNKLTKH